MLNIHDAHDYSFMKGQRIQFIKRIMRREENETPKTVFERMPQGS